LGIDTHATCSILEELPEFRSDAQRMANEIAESDATVAAIRTSAQPTLQMLSRNGVFDDDRIATAFAERDLMLKDAA
jgi:hypothetical protein